MPRRHPKPDDEKTGPSAAVLAERRAARAERRARKSPAEDRNALLTRQERSVLSDELAALRRYPETAERDHQIGSLRRELDLDSEACRGGVPHFS